VSIPTAENEETTPPTGHEEVFHFGHKFPNGEVVQHERIESAQVGATLHGGDVVARQVFPLPWFRMPEGFQPKWVTPE
jgi:hypothetical protein